MTSEDPVKPAEPKAKAESYRIHNVVREIATRTQRHKQPVHHRFVQRFGGGQITVRRARPATVTKVVLLRFLSELKKAQEEGRIVVRTMTGQDVDLSTLEPLDKTVPPSKPLPNPPLDSAANDKTFEFGVGNKVEVFEGGGVPGGERPPLNVKPSLTSEDAPIQATGDPARARAAEAKSQETKVETPVVSTEAPPAETSEASKSEPKESKPKAEGESKAKDKSSKKDGGK